MNSLWKLIARVITRNPSTVDWIIRRAMRTPYTHITSADGKSIYMGRWWLFNPYTRRSDGEQGAARFAWLPSVRIHHICRPDQDRDLHDHPWNARTIILDGWYREERPAIACSDEDTLHQSIRFKLYKREYLAELLRQTGYTGRLKFGEYHRISEVSAGGVWTIFITGRKRGTWGFMVKGKKVPWRTYLGLDKKPEATDTNNKTTTADQGATA